MAKTENTSVILWHLTIVKIEKVNKDSQIVDWKWPKKRSPKRNEQQFWQEMQGHKVSTSLIQWQHC